MIFFDFCLLIGRLQATEISPIVVKDICHGMEGDQLEQLVTYLGPWI